jgi:hypothetical protein
MQAILWIVVGLIGVTFGAAFLLPKKAREDAPAH